MTPILNKLKRWGYAAAYSICLFYRFWLVRRRLDRRIGVQRRMNHFPQLEWRHCQTSCQSIFSVAEKTDRVDEIQYERQQCFRLWQHVDRMTTVGNPLRSPVSRMLRDAVLRRTIGLILKDFSIDMNAVSYTHLTLPTICSV